MLVWLLCNSLLVLIELMLMVKFLVFSVWMVFLSSGKGVDGR